MPLNSTTDRPTDEPLTRGRTLTDKIHYLYGNDGLSGLPLRQFSHAQVRFVVDYIHANLDRALNLCDLSNLVNVSPRNFLRIFCKTVGTTPHRYLMNERVTRARELIAKGQALAEIATDLGFANQSHFCGVFRKVTGMSPGRFRQEHRSKLTQNR
jgi:transcriptional regulator GlxA family with amidase domain